MNAFLKTFLLPLSVLWDTLYRLRRFCYHYGIFSQNTFCVPIISVGNLTFGGTGKTPFTLWLSQYFHKKGMKTMILTRGYKGKFEHSSDILRSNRRLGHLPLDYGDEALILARRSEGASIVVGKNRSENLERYFSEEKPDIVVLDDGHQHLKLARDINIVLFDLLMPTTSYRVAPMGYMREGFSALYDADAIVLGRADSADEHKKRQIKEMLTPHVKDGVVFAEMYYRPTAFVQGSRGKRIACTDMAGRRVVCVAGVASPKSFFLAVKAQGCIVVEALTFPDHHRFSVREIEDIVRNADEEDAIIVTTEKDMANLKNVTNDETIYYLEIEAAFSQGQRELVALFEKVCNRAEEPIFN